MSGCASCDFEDLRQELQSEFPTYSIKQKYDSWLMKAIDLLLRCITFGMMHTFLTDYVTTIGFTVYVPESWAAMTYEARIIVLRHERVHMRQRVKYGTVLFSLLYLLCPLPGGVAYFRMKFEREAYAETLKAVVDVYQDAGRRLISSKAYQDSTIANFTGPAYFWMWPFKRSMDDWYEEACRVALARA